MTWTYSGNPSASSCDQARFLIGDTDPDDPLVTDEEITAQLSISGGPMAAAAALARALAAKYSRKIDKSIDGLSIQYSQLSKNFLNLSKTLDAQNAYAALAGGSNADGAFYAGGVYQADTDTDEANEALKQPSFKRDQFVNTGNL